MKIIVYDDNEIKYMEGYVKEIKMEPNFIDTTTITSTRSSRILLNTTAIIVANVEDWKKHIDLDPTEMKRIAKYNKEVEIEELNKEIERLKDTIKELDDIIYDKRDKVGKIKHFIADIYNINEEDMYDEDDDYDED